MSVTLDLSLACVANDRTRPIPGGRVAMPGLRLTALPGKPEDIFRHALRDCAFDTA